MFDKEFWKATGQRMVRAAAAAVGGVWIAGDVVFDVFNLHDWQQVGSLAGGTAFFTLLMCLAGEKFTNGNGPSFGNVETTNTPG